MKLEHRTALVGLLIIVFTTGTTVVAQTVDNSSNASSVIDNTQTTSVESFGPSQANKRIAANAIKFQANLFDENNGASTKPDPAPQAPDPDEWQFVFSPYFWMAGLHGTTGGPNRTVQVNEPFADIFDSLKFAFMGVFEAHKNKWAIQTDVEFVSLEDEKATPGPLFSSATAEIKTFVFTPEVGYRIYDSPDKSSFVQVLGGVRIYRISVDLNLGPGILPAVQVKNRRSWVDAVVGLRGKAALSEKFFLMGRFDVGGGGSKFTYQLFGGLGYNLNEKIALVGGYRALDVNYDRNNFLYDTSQRGPIMGVGFRF